MSTSKSCPIIMHDADDTVKRFGSSSNMIMIMHVDGGHVISISSSSANRNGSHNRAPFALENGDGDDDDDDGGYDYAPAA
ncbi:hypothetical protein GQ457_HM000990 [Hibiscus cannabinus]